MQIKVSLDDVKDHVEPGWYLTKVVGAEIKDANAGDSQYIRWEHEIIEPDSPFNGWKIRHNTSLKPTALWRLKSFLEACDFAWGADGFTTEEVLGSEVEAKVEEDEYQGNIQANIVNFKLAQTDN